MLDPQTLLEVFHAVDEGSSVYSFMDYKKQLGDVVSAPVSLVLATTDYIYIGFEQPIKNFYVDIITPNPTLATMVVTSWDGSAWADMDAIDETYGFSKSGMVHLFGEHQQTTVANKTKYFVRIAIPDGIEAEVNFIGCLLSTDSNLIVEVPYILDQSLLMNQPSHTKIHLASRDEIIQKFLNKGFSLKSGDRLTYWQLLDIQELRQASIFLTLSKIYFALSDNTDDSWLQKAREYRGLYNKQVEVFRLSLDLNQDGKKTTGETTHSSVSQSVL